MNFLKSLKKRILLWLKLQTLKSYYNNKYPKKNITYRRTTRKGTIEIDVRQFLNPHNFMLPDIRGKDDDETAFNGLMWVIKNIKYTPDKKQYGLSEYWCHGYETFNTRLGDCEDGAILLYDILRKNGIPAWKLRVTAGWVKVGKSKAGHAYLTYYSVKHDKWVILDWCFYPSYRKIADREPYYENPFYLDVWFSFNEEYAWAKAVGKEAKEFLKNK